MKLKGKFDQDTLLGAPGSWTDLFNMVMSLCLITMKKASCLLFIHVNNNKSLHDLTFGFVWSTNSSKNIL